MVRMRDVLKSVRDVKPTERRNHSAEPDSADRLRFPGPARSESGARPEDAAHAAVQAPAAEERAATPQAPPTTELYGEAIEAVERFLQKARNREPFDLEEIESYATKFVDTLTESDQLFLKALSARTAMTSMAQHSATVAVVAIKVASGLEYSRRERIEVGICALVHEVGMMHVPDDVLEKRGELSSSESEEIRKHPLHGKKILEAVRDKYPYLPDVVAQEHERWNGKGYPHGLSEDDIHEYAQVLGLADTFVALTHLRHYRDNFIAYKAIQSIIERRNIDFSARLIKALIDVISIFPVHSLVKLNNGSIARVVKTNPSYPVRPVIELVANARGQRVEKPQIIDLSNEPMIYKIGRAHV